MIKLVLKTFELKKKHRNNMTNDMLVWWEDFLFMQLQRGLFLLELYTCNARSHLSIKFHHLEVYANSEIPSPAKKID